MVPGSVAKAVDLAVELIDGTVQRGLVRLVLLIRVLMG